jgi:hypothetical protein
MDLREKFKKEKGYGVMAVRQDYAGQRPYEDGFCDDYVEWLEAKVKNLSISIVSQRSELLLAFLNDAEERMNLVMLEPKEKTIDDFS